jgi:hypothetical protein
VSVTSRVQMESLVNGLYASMDCSLMQLIKFATGVGMLVCYRVFVMQIYSKDASTKTFLHTFKIANAKVLLLLRSRPGTGPLNQLH